MGCDIHFFVERKVDGGWEQIDAPDQWNDIKKDMSGPANEYWRGCWFSDRDYVLFGKLAGARSEYVPIAPPRGLPSDVSQEVKSNSDDWSGDGHSHSHFTVAELEAAFDADERERFGHFMKVIDAIKEHVGSDARVVFWFDN